MRRAVSLLLALLATTTLLAERRRAVRQPGGPWRAGLTASAIPVTSILGNTLEASSRLRVTWNAQPGTHHYVIRASDVADSATLSFDATTSPAEIGSLESGTDYRLSITACLDASCSITIAGDATATARTSDEYWQIRGSGSSYTTAAKIVSDGNTKPWVLKWGAEAGAALAGFAQLYYDPISGSEKGIKLATSALPVTGADSIASFTPLPGFGVRRSDTPPTQGTGPATFQIVPMKDGRIRLFYEASSADGRGRIWSVDAQDGWQGRDFHRGAATQCQQSELAAGGPCQATLLIGTESDGNAQLREARQFKLLLPSLDTWLWDGAAGTSMIFTAHFNGSACSPTFFNAGFASWDGTRWTVQYAANGCPKLIPGVQAPMPVHLGGTRYKLYFNHNTGDFNRKPLKLLYSTGPSYEEWEPIIRAREIHVLWPTGVELTETEESAFDDYQAWMPTEDPLVQVIYSNMTCPANACGPPFIGMAVLVNP